MIQLKNKEEIDGIRRSGRILAETRSLLTEALREGLTTAELDALAYNYITSQNAIPTFLHYSNFPASLCISVNDEVIHGIPGKRVLLSGDIVSIDLGVTYKGFISDSAFTAPVGRISREAERLMKVTEECLHLGIQEARTGNRIKDVSKAVYNHATRHGYGVVREYCGHGVGKELHEEPQIPNYIHPGPNPRIKPGMVLAIEPMINAGTDDIYVKDDGWTVVTLDGSLSAHFEHTVAVFQDHTEILTTL
ncbi:MAG: type I methionyl aminopeptidase [Spirochaetales bacterium]|nr:type I methionyl aminopeptidase [Spirochaetales bacterium]